MMLITYLGFFFLKNHYLFLIFGMLSNASMHFNYVSTIISVEIMSNYYYSIFNSIAG